MVVPTMMNLGFPVPVFSGSASSQLVADPMEDRSDGLQYAVGLSPMEANLVKDLSFISSTCAGTQQIRLDIGHALFGARVEYGDPLFITISPSSRHSGLCIRFSRYRNCDPAIVHERRHGTGIRPWHSAQKPSLWANPQGIMPSGFVP